MSEARPARSRHTTRSRAAAARLSNPDRTAWWISLALIAIAAIVYAPVARYPFVNWDDELYVSQNPQVAGGLTLSGAQWAFTQSPAGNWHPVTWLSHMLDVQLFGLNSGAHHVVNLIFHIANTLLVFLLLQRMTGATWRSAFVAAVFAAHPLHVESVAWLAERKDVLSTFFGLLTVWAFLEYVGRPSTGRYLAMAVLFALGLMAKSMLVTLPFVLLLLDVWPLRRLRPGSGHSADAAPADTATSTGLPLSRLVREKLPLFALSIVSSIVTVVVQSRGGALMSPDRVPLGIRLSNPIVAYASYIVKTLWPVHLACLYPYPRSLPAWQVAGSVLLLALISLLVIRVARRQPAVAVGWCGFLGTLMPVIGWVQVGSQSMADRYLYVPMLGLVVMVAWGLPALLAAVPQRATVLGVTATLVVVACMAVASRQVQTWRDSTTLWTHALSVTKNNYVAHNNLGLVLERQNRLDEAAAHYAEAVRLEHNFAIAHCNLAGVLVRQGRLDEAIAHYHTAIQIEPDYAAAHQNLGAALVRQGRIDEGIAEYRQALRVDPKLAKAHDNLGAALMSQNRLDEAIREYDAALSLAPDDPETHHHLGTALAVQNRLAPATTEFETAIRLDPNEPQYHNSLGKALANQSRLGEAAAEFQEALRLSPRDAEVRANLTAVQKMMAP